MRKLIIAVVSISAVTGLSALAWTALSQHARPAAAGDSFLSIPACAFNDYVDGSDFIRGGSLHFVTGSGSFYAPVNLPNGSIIKKIILICIDNNGSDNIDLQLRRVPQSGSTRFVASVSSSGSDDSWRTFAQKLTSNKYVNTWKYSYYLWVNLPGTGGAGYYFSQAKIVYTPPSP